MQVIMTSIYLSSNHIAKNVQKVAFQKLSFQNIMKDEGHRIVQ